MIKAFLVAVLAAVCLVVGSATATAEPVVPDPAIIEPVVSDASSVVTDVARPPGDTAEGRTGGGALIGMLVGGLIGLPFLIVGAIPGAIIGAAVGAGIGFYSYLLTVPMYGP
ncbi:hypothetical protein [Antrihabitans sp. YC2-6]|uniref:hypothetical protein n=1 Tax=Antrihabitans sp. YC2-6 TaxID=2799498 RepID=UPI0018F4DD25|nr:hypothetical protein [Antrihabitans sp. YC2-6]MBJ8343778.1 hypothetical protein [Antrihabitans sp. YC2-6]